MSSFFFSSRRRHTIYWRDWSSDVCSSDLMDESRIGLQTIRRRRITACGTPPVGRLQHCCENFSLYGAVAPGCGDGYFLGLSQLNAPHFQIFLDAFAGARPHTLNALFVAYSRPHT